MASASSYWMERGNQKTGESLSEGFVSIFEHFFQISLVLMRCLLIVRKPKSNCCKRRWEFIGLYVTKRIEKEYGCRLGWIQGFHSLDKLCPQGEPPAPPPSSIALSSVPRGTENIFLPVTVAKGPRLTQCFWLGPMLFPGNRYGVNPVWTTGTESGGVLAPQGKPGCWSGNKKHHVVSFCSPAKKDILFFENPWCR